MHVQKKKKKKFLGSSEAGVSIVMRSWVGRYRLRAFAKECDWVFELFHRNYSNAYHHLNPNT